MPGESFSDQIDQVVARAGPLWPELDGHSILLTGGTGFFGRWLLETMLRAQQQLGLTLDLAVLTRNADAFRSKAPQISAAPSIRLIEGDVRSVTKLDGAFSFILHGAATSAKATFDGEDPLAKFETAFDGTRRILDIAVASKARVLMLGSGSVYGGLSHAGGPVSEAYLGAPSTLDTDAGLGHGKRAAEFLCAYYADRYGLSVTIARCFSFIGAFLPFDLHYAIGNFIKDALEAEQITVRGDGRPVRSYLFAGDLVVWLLTLLLRGSARTVYNVGSDRAITLADLATCVGSVLAPGKPVRTLGQPTDGPRSMYVPDISRAQGELGLAVWTPLEDAIGYTADAYRAAPWGDG